MYRGVADPYCYAGTMVLKNIPGLRDPAALVRFESAVTAQRADEALPAGRFSVGHYRAVHRHIFQDVYRWAGRFRTVRISKADSVFCYPEHIPRETNELFARLKAQSFLQGLTADWFAMGAAQFLSTLNAIHPFRDGNGRTQLVFLALLSAHAGHPIALEQLDANAFLAAMIASFHGNERLLARQLRKLIW